MVLLFLIAAQCADECNTDSDCSGNFMQKSCCWSNKFYCSTWCSDGKLKASEVYDAYACCENAYATGTDLVFLNMQNDKKNGV